MNLNLSLDDVLKIGGKVRFVCVVVIQRITVIVWRAILSRCWWGVRSSMRRCVVAVFIRGRLTQVSPEWSFRSSGVAFTLRGRGGMSYK